eukprot:1190308-Pyramimonas_sp.AAC.1
MAGGVDELKADEAAVAVAAPAGPAAAAAGGHAGDADGHAAVLPVGKDVRPPLPQVAARLQAGSERESRRAAGGQTLSEHASLSLLTSTYV